MMPRPTTVLFLEQCLQGRIGKAPGVRRRNLPRSPRPVFASSTRDSFPCLPRYRTVTHDLGPREGMVKLLHDTGIE